VSLGLGLGAGFGGGDGAAAPDPLAAYTLSLYLDGDNYSAGTWTGSASAGTSATHNATTVGANPTAGTALNGHGTVLFTAASSQFLRLATATSNLMGVAAWSFWCLCNPTAIGGVFCTEPGDDLRLALIAGPNWQIRMYSGGYQTQQSATSLSAWQLLQAKYDGTNMKVRVNSGAWASWAQGHPSLASQSNLGAYQDGSSTFGGTMANVGAAASTLSDGDFDAIKTILNTRYGLSL
jgi:hypothetical protein